jgi:hypothetical protein
MNDNEDNKLPKARVQKTNGIEAYWHFYCNNRVKEGWILDGEKKAVVFQSISDGKTKIEYNTFSALLKLYYKNASNLVIKGHRLRFDYGLGNLRVIRYDGRNLLNKPGRIMYKNPENIDYNIPQCAFCFHRDEVDVARKRANKMTFDNISIFDLVIARSNGESDKNLGLKFKLSHMIKINPSLVQLYDIKKIKEQGYDY